MRALLGLYDPADTTDWGPIRAAQMNAGSQLALFMLAVNVVGAALVTLNFAPSFPLWKLASWSALVAAVGVAVAFRRLAVRHRTERTATLKDVRETGSTASRWARSGRSLRCSSARPPMPNRPRRYGSSCRS